MVDLGLPCGLLGEFCITSAGDISKTYGVMECFFHIRFFFYTLKSEFCSVFFFWPSSVTRKL